MQHMLHVTSLFLPGCRSSANTGACDCTSHIQSVECCCRAQVDGLSADKALFASHHSSQPRVPVWGYTPAHTMSSPHDPPHTTTPPRDDPSYTTQHNNSRLSATKGPQSSVCSLLPSKSRTFNVLDITPFRLSSCSLIREITVLTYIFGS